MKSYTQISMSRVMYNAGLCIYCRCKKCEYKSAHTTEALWCLVLQFADHHDISHFYEVSAKTGENVTESFEAFFREIHRKVSRYTSLTHVHLYMTLYMYMYYMQNCIGRKPWTSV